MRPQTLSWMLSCLCLTLVGCSKDLPAVVGLLDQIPELEPAGPWRVALDSPDIHVDVMIGSTVTAGGLELNGKDLVGRGGVVDLSIPVRAGEGETFIGAFDLDQLKDDRAEIEAVLAGIRDSTATPVSSEKGPRFVLRTPPGGATRLTLRFRLARGALFPIGRFRLLSLPPDADHREARRLDALNALASHDTWGISDWMLAFRRFPLQDEGLSRQCVALVGIDTLGLALPNGCSGAELRFWRAALRGKPHVRVDLRSARRWSEATYATMPNGGGGLWRDAMLTTPLGRHADSLRFISRGEPGDVLVIGEPRVLARERAPAKQNNLILIDLDTMRADRLGCYGYRGRPTSVELDSILAAKGFAVFRRAYSAGSHTLPATAKFMTSRYLNIHSGSTVPRQYTTVAEVLRHAGFYCAAFTSGGALRSPGFEQGFHEYHFTPRGNGKVEEVFPPVCAWLEEAPPSPFFLFVHTYESHGPYTRDRFCRGLPHGRLGNLSKGELLLAGAGALGKLSAAESLYVQAAYDGGVAKACGATAELLRTLERLDLWQRTVVVILSDHGEEFWEHSEHFAAHLPSSVYGELLNVPFLLYAPELRSEAVTYVDTPVSTVDLLPTVCDLFKIEPQERLDGASVLPLLEGRPLGRKVPILATNDESRTLTKRACLITEAAKYIMPLGTTRLSGMPQRGPLSPDPYSPDPALFFLGVDPREIDDRSLAEPYIAAMMEESLHTALARAQKPFAIETSSSNPSLSPELREQLRALGYVTER